MRAFSWILATSSAGLLTATLLGPATAHGTQGCPRVPVPGAAYAETACLDDLTTAGTVASGHTDPADWAGLHAPGTRNPSGVPGIQVDGYFPDSSTLNNSHGWKHDSQFVLRMPKRWNGGLVITGAPGVREQYANDFIIGDWVLAKGYAFASTDKGNVGTAFHTDGRPPGDAVAEWHTRVTQLAKAAKATTARHYGKAPRRTYVTGISNGGYLTRWQLERHPGLYDGGVDWEGTLFTADGPNLFTSLPPALRHYPRYRATGDPAAHQAILDAGFAPGSEPLWDFHYAYYWDLTQRIYREEFDPGYDGDTEAGYPFCVPGSIEGCDADYDYASRPESVHRAVERVSLTGNVSKPMITLHGDLDTLLPIRVDSDVYAQMGSKPRYRYYRIEGGNHVDGLYPTHPDLLRPILPCYREAFTALERWTDDKVVPPASATLPRPSGGDLVNDCELTV
ncbi:MAG: tannase/feruloyl esterase family alpha/beta hydrolase [Micromonosporaceae bacterium]